MPDGVGAGVEAAGLQRFLAAQTAVYEQVLRELRAGSKTGHWMWFVFPQIAGLGRTAISQKYAVATLDEAVRYLAEPTLGSRLRECCGILVGLAGHSAEQIFGDVDAMKLRSSLTLFAAAAPDEALFKDALKKYFGGEPDERTLRILQSHAPL
jgi:uncharacterized protein (DUF1810 family)